MRLGFALLSCIVTACRVETDYIACTDLQPGVEVRADVGGSTASRTELQAMMEFAGVAAVTSLELTSICSQMALELGTPQEAIDAALAATKDDARMISTCKLAADALAREHEPIVLSSVMCTPVPQFSCLKTCVPSTKECGDACDAAAGAKADCPEPHGVALHFGPILAMRARLDVMAASAHALSSAVDAIADIKAVCIPYARDRVHDANDHVANSQKAVNALIVAAGGG